MCLAIPLKIKTINEKTALCHAKGLTQTVRIDFTPEARPGDYVMVHAGFAIQTMTEQEARENIELLEDIKDAL